MSSMRIIVAVMAAAGSLVLGASAHAVTTSQPDGDGHPYAGMFVGDFVPDLPGLEPGCSGTLIAPTVFLTAAHCIANRPERQATQIYVTFDAEWTLGGSPAGLYRVGSYYWHPDWIKPGFPADDDLAVFILETTVTGTAPARLPAAGLLDELAQKGGLVGAAFDVVGYGLQGFETGGGPPQPIGSPQTGVVERRTATSRFQALTHDVLNLFTEDALGYGGNCVGDSGGPHFLAGTDMVVATSSWIDNNCEAYTANVRLDTAQARSFLGQYLSLP